MMERNEIKKALYREKPLATNICETNTFKEYLAVLKDETEVYFNVPFDEMGENEFSEEISAQLLIRWLVCS